MSHGKDASARPHVGAMLAERARVSPDKDFLRFAERSMTYSETNDAVRDLANGFMQRGIRPGDAVCVMLPNCSEYVLAWLALARIGAVTVSVNTGYKELSLRRSLRAANASMMLVDIDYLDTVAAVTDEVPDLQTLIVRGHLEGSVATPRPVSIERFEDLAVPTTREVLVDVAPRDPLMMVFTSGTSGLPKPVEISHAYALIAAEDSAVFTGLQSDDVLYCAYPLYHSEAPLNIVLPGLYLGATVAIGSKFTASGFWAEINRFEATFFTFLGGVVNILLAQPARADDASNTARRAFGCPIPDNWREFEERFGVSLFEWYAATEGGMLAFDPLDTGHVQGSCGVPSQHYELRIVNEDGFEVPAGEPGEILTRSRRPYGQMTGYYEQPEATLEVFRDLWYHTRDLGYLDEAGRLYYIGRVGDAIRRRGVNISSLEVEQVLNRHPRVIEAAVVGVPGELGEQDVKAVVMTVDELAPEELVAFAQEGLPRAMVPRYVEILTDLPRTPTGKILKRTLREQWRSTTTYDAERGAMLPSAGAGE